MFTGKGIGKRAMTHESIAKFIKMQREEQGISCELSEEELNIYLNTVELTEKQFISTLLALYVKSITHNEKITTAYNEEYNKNVALNKTIEELKKVYRLGGKQVQAAKVKNGLRYNKKQGSVNELQMLIKMGLSDEEIMGRYNISKSTLWRWKKRL